MVIMRLKRMGSKKHPFYRIVAADSRNQRDGRFIEIIGSYDPMKKPHEITVDREKVVAWLEKGSQMSNTVESLFRKEGIIQAFNAEKYGSQKQKAENKSEEKTETTAATE